MAVLIAARVEHEIMIHIETHTRTHRSLSQTARSTMI